MLVKKKVYAEQSLNFFSGKIKVRVGQIKLLILNFMASFGAFFYGFQLSKI